MRRADVRRFCVSDAKCDCEAHADDLSKALQEGTYEPKVQADMDSGEASGVHGTPTFYVNGKLHAGSFAYENLAKAIEPEAR